MAANVVGAADVARVGPPDMGPERATLAFRVVCGVTEIVQEPVRIASQIP